MKKIISLVLVFSLLMSLQSDFTAMRMVAADTYESVGQPYIDDMVSEEHWAFDALAAAIESGMIRGSDGKIEPNKVVTRAEMFTMFLRVLGLDDSSGDDLSGFMGDISRFEDVNTDDWFYGGIAMAYKLGLTNGTGENEMSPDGTMTREQAFTVICRFMNLDTGETDESVLDRFNDKGDVSGWAVPYLSAMVRAGFINGTGENMEPLATITRQEFAQLMYNIFSDNYIASQDKADSLAGKSVTGNLIISAPGIELKDLVIDGDLIIGDGAGNGEATLRDVSINGRLIIRGGGSDSIYLENTTAERIIIEKLSDGSIYLHGDDGSPVEFLEINDGNDSIYIDCTIMELTINGDDIDLIINGTVNNMNIFGSNVSVSGTGSLHTISVGADVMTLSVLTGFTKIINDTDHNVTVTGANGWRSVLLPESSVKTRAVQTVIPGYEQGYSTVSFHSNGGESVDPISVLNGSEVGELPLPAKENSIFIGWFRDQNIFGDAVTGSMKVNSDIDLYAGYVSVSPDEGTDLQTVSSIMDTEADHQITIISSNTGLSADDVKAGLSISNISDDDADEVAITVTGSSGIYYVNPVESYLLGKSYSLVLENSSLIFKDKSSNIRTYNFTVKNPDPVLNLELDADIIYVPSTDISNITMNGEMVSSIFAPLYYADSEQSPDDIYGSFTYSGSLQLNVGDSLAVYSGTAPDQRVAGVDYGSQQIGYVIVSGISGNTISYGNADPSEIIFTPDVLPVDISLDADGSPDNYSITIEISDMTYTDEKYSDMGLNSLTTIDPGDFMAFFAGEVETAELINYARILTVSSLGGYYVISYEITGEAEVLASMDMAASRTLDYDDITATVDLEEMNAEIERQSIESGFAQEAADFFIALAQADEDTRIQVCDAIGIKNFQISTMEVGAVPVAFTAPSVIVVTNIGTKLEHFTGDGFRAEITITTDIKLGDNMKLTVSGTFVEEFSLDLRVASETIWKKKWIFPYIYDYKVTAGIIIKNYTYLSLGLNLVTVNKAGFQDSFHIEDTIKTLKKISSASQASTEVQEFYELYKSMMEKDHGFFDLFKVPICKIPGWIDPLFIIAYNLNVEFVVSMDADIALGAQFSYEKVTAYLFSFALKDKTSEQKSIDLVEEQYNLIAYAMGTLALRAGIRVTVEVGLFCVKLASAGVSGEIGAYVQVWGFVYYELNHKGGVTTTKSEGGCYLEIGWYVTIKFKAQVGDGKIASYSKPLYNYSEPLFTVGSQYFIYNFAYELNAGNDDIAFRGSQGNYILPASVFLMSCMDFKTGEVSIKYYEPTNFTFTIKDDPEKVFSINPYGLISVNKPSGAPIATATLQVAWKKQPLTFSTAPLSRVFKLTWDNLADSYILSFDTVGGNNVGAIQAKYGTALSMPVPMKPGYVFIRWYTDNTYTKAFSGNTMPAQNMVLYAKWTPGTVGYTVRHYVQNPSGGGYTLADVDSLSGITAAQVTPDVKSYTGFVSPSPRTVTLAGDGSTVVEYYYLPGNYLLTFKPANGSGDIVSSLKYGAEITAPSVIRNGYQFTGWGAVVPDTMPAGNLTFTAQWTLRTYGISYDLKGGTVPAPNPVTYSILTNSFTLNNPTPPEGYNFAGWTGTGLGSATRTVTIPAGSTGNRYYTAVWTPVTNTSYTVRHVREDLDGNYRIIEIQAMTGTTGSLTNASARTYTGFTAGSVTQQTIAGDGSTSVVILYSRNSYLLTFDANGGEGGTSENVRYQAAIVPPEVTHSTLTFAGWNTEVAAAMPAGNLTYIAQWAAQTYKVTFVPNDASASGSMPDQQFTTGVSQNLSANAYTLTGYTFTGWNTESDGNGTRYENRELVSNLTSEANGTVTLYAQWKPSLSSGIFDSMYSATYQVFDFITSSSYINGRAYDSSWGSASFSSGHQFSAEMLNGRYFKVRKTGDSTHPIALYMYEADGTPVVSGISENLYSSSLIGLESNTNLTTSCKTALEGLYGTDWAEGLVATGTINALWDEGYLFNSANGFGYFISGKRAYTSSGPAELTNRIDNPSMAQIEAVTDFEEGPLTQP